MTKSELLQIAKPILFNTEMVRAILDGRKTQTRRAIKNLPEHTYKILRVDQDLWEADYGISANGICMDLYEELKPPYQTGQVLYVRETWNICNMDADRDFNRVDFIYKAEQDEREYVNTVFVSDEEYQKYDERMAENNPEWRPSIHMPKEAARIFLRVTGVRAKKLQDIMKDPPGPNNAIVKEGYQYGCNFIAAWESTVKKSNIDRYGWNANPWVWTIEFERIEIATAVNF